MKVVVFIMKITAIYGKKYQAFLVLDLPLLDNGRNFAPMLNLHNEYADGQFIESNGSKHLMKGLNKKGVFILTPQL